MKNVIIVHGMPDKKEYYSAEFSSMSNSHWLPWLQKQLMMKDVKADTPEMPHAYAPDYEVWKREFERFDITQETILVGHSCGGGFLVRWLSEQKEVKVGKVVLVAPWLDPDNENQNNFFDFTIDGDLSGRTGGVSVFVSDDDEADILLSVEMITVSLPEIRVVSFKNKGHFTYGDMKSEAFPELLEEVLK
jgi:predicted alpha/beta hydrolase family esterase